MKLKNQRRFPTDMDILADKSFNDIIYCLLQVESNHTEGEQHRYISKKKVNKSEWANTLNMSLSTFKRKFNYLISSGSIEETEEYYIIPNNISRYYYMIPVETMRFMCNNFNPDVFKIYSHLGRLYETGGTDAYFTKKKLISVLGGKSTTNKRDWDKVNDILRNLRNNGLIAYEEEYDKGNKNMIARYKIKYVNKTPK